MTTDSQPVPKQQSRNPEIANFAKLHKKFKFLDKRGFKLMQTRKANSCPLCPTHPYTKHDAHGTESLRWPAWLAAWPCSLPAHPLNMGDWKRPLISQQQLKPSVCYPHPSHTKSKHSSYWEENYPSPNQDTNKTYYFCIHHSFD